MGLFPGEMQAEVHHFAVVIMAWSGGDLGRGGLHPFPILDGLYSSHESLH